ncbi:MAG: MFS transporter [Chloroflexota bacterium]|nr:MFS transporter [Chloroflexota bacterium]
MKQTSAKGIWGVSRNVFVLGWVSLLTDVSSEMIFNVFPLFLSHVLGVGATFIGLIEGLGEATSTLLKLASGWASDRLERRKGLTVAGYALSTVAKPFLLLATSGAAALAIRFFERAGKGVRTSPRDALVADSATEDRIGRSFGFHRALDTAGAISGIAIAAAIVYLIQGWQPLLSMQSFRWLVIVGVVPAALAVVLLVFFVREARANGAAPVGPGQPSKPTGLDRRFKVFLAVMLVFTLGNSADVFLVLQASNIGFSPVHILLMLLPMNLVYAATSYPFGRLSDRVGRKRLIVAAWAVYALTYVGFAQASATWHIAYVLLLFAVYGVYYGASEGVTRAFVADMVPKKRRGTAYGLYHATIGLSLLLASVIAGALWEAVGPAATFYFGAGMAGVAMLAFAVLIKE